MPCPTAWRGSMPGPTTTWSSPLSGWNCWPACGRWCDVRRGQAASVLELGDVRIDLASRTVARQGVAISLTPREYALVEFLALHRGKVVTRTMLYDHLFDENEDSLSNLLDVHVSNLRKKLGADFVVTRRGQGYLIDV